MIRGFAPSGTPQGAGLIFPKPVLAFALSWQTMSLRTLDVKNLAWQALPGSLDLVLGLGFQ